MANVNTDQYLAEMQYIESMLDSAAGQHEMLNAVKHKHADPVQKQIQTIADISETFEGAENIEVVDVPVADARIAEVDAVAQSPVSQGSVMYQLFYAASRKLALPLNDIAQILDNSTVKSGEYSLQWGGKNIPIINIERLTSLALSENKTEQYYIVTAMGFALQCDQLLNMENISSEIVTWYNGNSSEPWILGRLKTKDLSIIDMQSIEALAAISN